MRHIKQRKGNCFIQELSDDEDDEDDKYDSGIFSDRNAQNLRRIKQRKGLCFIQTSSDDEDDKDDDLITPYIFQDFRFQNAVTTAEPLLKPVCRFVRFFERNQKSTRFRAFEA